MKLEKSRLLLSIIVHFSMHRIIKIKSLFSKLIKIQSSVLVSRPYTHYIKTVSNLNFIIFIHLKILVYLQLKF